MEQATETLAREERKPNLLIRNLIRKSDRNPYKSLNNSMHQHKTNIMLLSGGIVISSIGMIEQWVWSPFWSLVFLLLVLFSDFITAVAVSKKRGGNLESEKLWLFALKLCYTVFLLGVAFNAQKLNAAFGINDERLNIALSSFPMGLYLAVFFSNLFSSLKNAVILGLVQGKVAEWIYKNFDQSKNHDSDKYFQKN